MPSSFVVNIVTANNEDLRQAFQITDTAGAALDLTGATIRLVVAGSLGTTVLEASTANSRIALSAPTAGKFEIAVPAADMLNVQAGVYRHDLLLTRAGAIKRVWSGSLTVEQGVGP